MITHHPSSELLLDYASGALCEAQALAVATHTALCALCRAEVERLESVGGAMLSVLGHSDATDDALLDQTLARLDEPAADTARTASSIDAATKEVVPSPLWPYLDGALDNIRWRRLGRGLHEASLPAVGANASLLRIGAGMAVPGHTHVGSEMTVVFAGGFSDADGHYIRGDFVFADERLDHRPVADADEDCLCLAVAEGPAWLTGPVGRTLNPLLGLIRRLG